jgi:hypothetical protein
MALGALSREEPGAAAPAERKSQNKGAPLGSTRWTFPFKSDAMLADPIRPSEQSRDNKHEPGKSFGIQGRITIHKGLEHLDRRNSDNRSQDFLFEP